MFALLPLLLAIALVVVAVLVVRPHLRRRGGSELVRRISVPQALAPGVRAARRAFMARVLLAALLAATIGTAALVLDDVAPGDLGRSILLAPGLMAGAGLAIVALRPTVHVVEAPGGRSADLLPRVAATYAPRWALLLPVSTGGLLLAAIAVLGLTSSLDDGGRYRAFTVIADDYVSVSTPYPGWFYGVPLAAVVLLVGGLAVVALHRVAAAPRPTDGRLREIDAIVRLLVARTIAKLTAGTFLVHAGVLGIVAAQAVDSASGQWFDGGYARVEPFSTLSLVCMGTGLVLLATGVALVALAVADAVRAPTVARTTAARVAS